MSSMSGADLPAKESAMDIITDKNEALPIGTRVSAWHDLDQRHATGKVVGYENDAYDATVNGRAVHYVRWDGGKFGGGWRAYDLTVR